MRWVRWLLPLLLLLCLVEGVLLGGTLGTLVAHDEEARDKEREQQVWREELGIADGASEEDVQQICAEQLDAERENIAISDYITVQKDTCQGKFDIGVSPESKYSYQVSIAVNRTDEVIFNSRRLDPGFCIPETKLDKPLPTGIYVCTVTFTAYVKDIAIPVGRLAKTTIIAVE